MEKLQSIVCVTLNIHLFSGRKKLTPKDLVKVAPGDLPPGDLASLGSKKICDPKKLNDFTRIKREASRLLLESGYRFLGGYGIPEDKLPEIKSELERLRCEFDHLRNLFFADYERSVDDWISRHPEWEGIIRQAVTPPERITLSFDFSVFRVQPAADEDGEDDLLQGSYHAILREVATDANATWEKSYKGVDRVTQKALRPLRRMKDKLNGLSFIDGRLLPVVETIQTALVDCPHTGWIEGSALNGLMGLMLLLCDTDKMVAHGEAALERSQEIVNGKNVDPLLVATMPQRSTETTAADEATTKTPIMASVPSVLSDQDDDDVFDAFDENAEDGSDSAFDDNTAPDTSEDVDVVDEEEEDSEGVALFF